MAATCSNVSIYLLPMWLPWLYLSQILCTQYGCHVLKYFNISESNMAATCSNVLISAHPIWLPFAPMSKFLWIQYGYHWFRYRKFFNTWKCQNTLFLAASWQNQESNFDSKQRHLADICTGYQFTKFATFTWTRTSSLANLKWLLLNLPVDQIQQHLLKALTSPSEKSRNDHDLAFYFGVQYGCHLKS